MGPEKTRAKHSAEKNEKKGSFEIALPVRLGISLVLVIISALIKMPVLIRTVLLILSAVIAGYDIFLSAVDSIAEKQFFSVSVLVLFAAVLAFVIGYVMEGALMVLLHQLSKILLEYTQKKALASAYDLVGSSCDDFHLTCIKFHIIYPPMQD